MLPSRSFMVSDFTIKSLIHFEFNFVYGIRKWFSFILLHVAAQFSQHNYWRNFFPIVYSCFLCHKLIDHRNIGLCKHSLFCFIDPCVWGPTPYCFGYCSFVVVWNQGPWCLQLCSTFSRLLWLFKVNFGFSQILELF